MEQLFRLSLSHLATYFRTFINVAADPLRSPGRLGLFSADRLEEGFLFFGISVLLAVIVKFPFIPETVDALRYAALDAVWKVVLVVGASAVARLAWLGCRGTFSEYLAANCHFFGVLSVLVPLIFVIMSQTPPGSALGTGYGLVLALLVFGWCAVAWLSYGRHNERSAVTSLGRLLVFLVFVPPLALTGLLIRSGTVIQGTGAEYFDPEVPVFGLALYIASFGFFP